MKRIVAVIVASVIMILSLSPRGMVAHASPRSAKHNTFITITIGPSTKALDIGMSDDYGSNGNNVPDGWQNIGFDDSSWNRAAQVPPDISACVANNAGNHSWKGLPAYWGGTETTDFLFRQDIRLPQADNYDGSLLEIGTTQVAPHIYDTRPTGDIFFNAHRVDGISINQDPVDFREYTLGPYLKPGQNVLALYVYRARAPSLQSGPCSAITFRMTIHANGIAGAPSQGPSSNAHQVRVIVPAQGASVSGAQVPFSWTPFPKAVTYYLQLWLVKPAAGQTITANSVVNYATRLTGTLTTVDVHLMPKGLYKWRLAAVDAKGALISDWTSERSLTLQ